MLKYLFMDEEKKNKIEEIVSKTFDVPSHCQIVLKVMNLFKNPYTSIDEIESLISKDKGFTSRFLRIANSPFYGLPRKVKTVKDALMLLGLETAKSLILATSSRYLYKNFERFEQDLWEHSLAVGLCSSLLSINTSLLKPEEALACGILHDLGKIFINNAIPENYQKIHDKIYKEEKSLLELETENFGFTHTEIGAFVAEKWNYPEEIKIAIKEHHETKCLGNQQKNLIDICKIVKVADQICSNKGIGFKKPLNINIDIQDIGIDSNSLKEIQTTFISQFNEQKKFLLE